MSIQNRKDQNKNAKKEETELSEIEATKIGFMRPFFEIISINN